MRNITFKLLILICTGFFSCRKTQNDPAITQYDDIQIQNYIKANGLTAMKRDTAGGDTTGIYYQILSQGSTSSTPMDYPDTVKFVFTLKSFDGKYTSVDSLTKNHYGSFLGHITQSLLPKGLQLAIKNVIKYKGTRARLLIPSRLAYGLSGNGSGSASNVNTRIAGNQCLDYYVNLVSDESLYDDQIIKNYMATNNLTGYTKVISGPSAGYYFKVTTPGTGTNPVGAYSIVGVTYTGMYLTNVVFDPGPVAGSTTSFDFANVSFVQGVFQGLMGYTSGTSISLLLPSRLGYGRAGNSTGTIAGNVCMRFDFNIVTVN